MNPSPTPPLLPTAYLPPVAYMAVAARHSTLVVEQHETFPKQTLRNRAVIATANGPLTLSVPVTKPYGNRTRTSHVGICYAEPWAVRHWRAIASAYNAAPFFLYYRDEIEHLLSQTYPSLLSLNLALLRHLLRVLKLDCTVTLSDDFRPASSDPDDYRTRFSDKRPSTLFDFPTYTQVFDTRLGFLPDICILDLLFNLGPDAATYLRRLAPPTPRQTT